MVLIIPSKYDDDEGSYYTAVLILLLPLLRLVKHLKHLDLSGGVRRRVPSGIPGLTALQRSTGGPPSSAVGHRARLTTEQRAGATRQQARQSLRDTLVDGEVGQ